MLWWRGGGGRSGVAVRERVVDERLRDGRAAPGRARGRKQKNRVRRSQRQRACDAGGRCGCAEAQRTGPPHASGVPACQYSIRRADGRHTCPRFGRAHARKQPRRVFRSRGPPTIRDLPGPPRPPPPAFLPHPFARGITWLAQGAASRPHPAHPRPCPSHERERRKRRLAPSLSSLGHEFSPSRNHSPGRPCPPGRPF